MKTIFRSLNKIALFNSLNQWALKLTWYWCTIFAPAINLKYNCWIKLTINDIMKIGLKQVKLWKLIDKVWGKWSDWIYVIYDYIVDNADDRWWKIPNLIEFKNTTKDKKELEKWIDRGYMVTIGIKVNKTFIKDARDWDIDLFDDYKDYKWTDLAHFTNITRWKMRFNWTKWSSYNKEQFVDSYAFNKKGNKWIYKCNIKEVLQDIAMPTKYIFY